MLHAVIMAGGSGTRFWPQSRRSTPKQLLCLAGDGTMLQQTVRRCEEWVPAERTWIVTNAVQAEATWKQLPQIPQSNTLVEPAARNTAPCIGLAAIRLLRQDPDATMFVMPADHVITPPEQFAVAARQAADIVAQDPDRLVLFGVTPTFPATGFGYIERGDRIRSDVAVVFDVVAFREKPHLDLAEEYLRSGRFYWNCGIFCWKARTIVNLLQQFEPDMHTRLGRIADALETAREADVLRTEFPLMKSTSIDYAVLERADRVAVIEAPFAWDDVGSWLALPRLNRADDRNNTVDGPACVVNSDNCIIRTTPDHLIATLGVDRLIIVHTPDVTLVADASQSERIRDVLDELETRGLQQYL